MAVSICCYKCGIVFSVPDHWNMRREEDGENFWCPNGHPQAYTENTNYKLRRERDRLKQQIARVEDEKRESLATADRAEAAKKRLEKRVGGGTCPCCTRTFSNLAEHMKHQHPEMAPRQMSKRRVTKRLALSAPKP